MSTKTAANKKTEAPSRAKLGSSLQAQAKQLVMELAVECKTGAEFETLADGTNIALVDLPRSAYDWLIELGEAFAAKAQRRIPLKVQLELIRSQMDEILQAANTENSKVEFSPEQETAYGDLITKKIRLQKAIEKEHAPETPA